MKRAKDHPGIYIPLPLFYVATFFVAVSLQKLLPLGAVFFHTMAARAIGSVLILSGVFFLFPAIRQFFTSKNTLITIKSAHSLQTTGIYTISRNPMYVGLLLLYLGLSFLMGNWWNLILLPVLVFSIQEYIIKREESYLTRRFGEKYVDYTVKVRRWL